MTGRSAVEFTGKTRIRVGLAVTDTDRSKQFYRTLFGIEPVKERPGYVKFEPADPSVNLTLNEVRTSHPCKDSATHYGVQVKSVAEVEAATDRFRRSGLETTVEENATCCYAVQDKVWVTDPDGNRWKIFVVLEADAPHRKDTNSTCCTTDAGSATCVSCC